MERIGNGGWALLVHTLWPNTNITSTYFNTFNDRIPTDWIDVFRIFVRIWTYDQGKKCICRKLKRKINEQNKFLLRLISKNSHWQKVKLCLWKMWGDDKYKYEGTVNINSLHIRRGTFSFKKRDSKYWTMIGLSSVLTITSILRKIDLHRNLWERHCEILHEEVDLQFVCPDNIKHKLLPSRAQEPLQTFRPREGLVRSGQIG